MTIYTLKHIWHLLMAERSGALTSGTMSEFGVSVSSLNSMIKEVEKELGIDESHTTIS